MCRSRRVAIFLDFDLAMQLCGCTYKERQPCYFKTNGCGYTGPPPRQGGGKVADVDGMISKLKELGAI